MKFRVSEGNPLVSVIIPVYNREETIGRAINSVLNQSYINFELIIVDDCSTDNSLKVIKKYEDRRIKVLTLQQNSGANMARNVGIASSKGHYIAFQDSDDEWDKNKLELQMRDMLQRHLAASFCAHRLLNGAIGTVIPDDYTDKEKYESGLVSVLRHHNVISTQTLIVRKDILSTVGNYDEDMPRLQDYEFAIRLAQKTRIGYVAQPLVSVYRTEESISTNIEALHKAVALLLIKHGKFLDIEALLRFFITHELAVKGGHRLYADCIKLQSILEVNNISGINILKDAMEYVTRRYCLSNEIQIRLYESQVERLESNRFIIYGAGDIAKKVFHRLGKSGIYPKCFLVTDNKEEAYINGIPVYSVDEWSDINITVIIGVASTLQSEIVDTLLRKNYKRIICYPYL